MATLYTVRAIQSYISSFAVCPHWDVARQSLYYVDLMSKGTILRYDAATDKTFKVVIEHATDIAFVIPMHGTPDQFVVSINGTVSVFMWNGISESASLDRLAIDIEYGNRMTDAKADPHGRLVCGAMPPTDFSGKLVHTAKANLYRFYQDEPQDEEQYVVHAAVKIVDKIGLPNGLSWNAREKKFYFIDSLAFDVKEYDYDGATGNVAFRRELIDFKVNGVDPKFMAYGMTIDSEGFLYVALFGASKVIKINPKTGAVELEIELPVPSVASVAFGGPELDILYVTTGSMNMFNYDFGVPSPVAGALFAVTGLGVKGLPMNNVPYYC